MGHEFDHLMRLAIDEAKKGLLEGEVPVGAVLADLSGRILAMAHNRPIALNDPSGHAEILALRCAGSILKNYRMPGTVLVVTIEPCLMCMAASINARITRLVFGATDSKAGAGGSVFNMASDSRLNHKIEVISGVMEDECRALMQDFFRGRRRDAILTDCGEVPKWS
ncbi:tRNA-specific adenosine deaminase [uncultured Desulfobacterium sp.]|uniref:tRNA-specific adenosine deaminase n=1 Tax=uncultured Desulfobacterium sp. TaxID=201089 RepID=A0A445N251_9BACT|nr:tRNA-specific adenosine deaminase [uncultured Desulfobacterium sp.]